MKKLFLKSFALVAMLLCGLTASASAVDWSTIAWAGDGAGGGTYENKYKVAFAESGLSLVNIQKTDNIQEAGFYIKVPDAAFGELRIAGTKAGYATQDVSFWLYISNFTAKETEVQVMTSDNNAVRWTIYVYYEDGTDVPAEPAETIKPTMTSASLASVTYNSAVINVAGTDKETENGAEVAVTRFKVVYGETSKTYTATDGQITITGLTPGTTYSFTIYAVDAAGNVSDDGLTVTATISADAPIISGTCSGKQSDKLDGNDFTNPYNYTFTTSGYEDNASVLVEFTFNDTKEGVVAYLWMNHSGFEEVKMAYDGTTKKASYTIKNLKKDDVIKVAVKFAYAGGMSVTSYIDYTVGTSCEAVVDNIMPTMGEASLVSASFNSAIINVAGTDQETEDGQEVAVTRFKVVYGETTKTYTATNGQITITDLIPGTAYSFTIYAVDAAGNVSDNFAAVEATTESLTYCDFPTGHEGNANFDNANGRILLTLKKMAVNKVQITVKPNTENGATQLLDYLYVAPSGAKAGTYTAGADITEGDGVASLSVEVEYEALPATMDFHLDWSNPEWNGRWAVSVNGVTAEMLCTEPEKPTAIDEIGQTISITKTIENGQIVIIREGVRYDVTGRAICK